MEQHDEPQGAQYPRGRGYGQDYMRGGEVFGGYGYSKRDEYVRPRGQESLSGSTEHPEPPDGRSADDPSSDETAGDEERFPQDARAGGWEIPHDLEDDLRATPPASEREGDAAGSSGETANVSGGGPPVPQIEHTFGDTGGNRLHSKSYYVTQAQLQQRLYAVPGETPLMPPGPAASEARPDVSEPDQTPA